MPYPQMNQPLGFDEGHPPVWGFKGSEKEAQLTWGGDTQIFYVDSGHLAASDDSGGIDPDSPLATLQALINRTAAFNAGTGGFEPILRQHDTIYVSGNIAETVIIPGVNVPTYVSIVGAGNDHAPTWTAATAPETALTIRREGWTVAGFTFEVGTAGVAIELDEVPGSSYSAYKTTIRDCRLDGLWGGLYGINLVGAPHRVVIENCEFLEFRRGDGSAFAVIVTDSSHVNPYECHMRDCVFWENENHVGSLGGLHAWNLSTFVRNIFHKGALIPSTIQLDLRGGSQGLNIVTRNTFFGDYSNPGGYYANAGAPDYWMGNFSDDVTEVEVDTTTGLTIAPPAP
jgi:hypothetical protein